MLSWRTNSSLFVIDVRNPTTSALMKLLAEVVTITNDFQIKFTVIYLFLSQSQDYSHVISSSYRFQSSLFCVVWWQFSMVIFLAQIVNGNETHGICFILIRYDQSWQNLGRCDAVNALQNMTDFPPAGAKNSIWTQTFGNGDIRQDFSRGKIESSCLLGAHAMNLLQNGFLVSGKYEKRLLRTWGTSVTFLE